MTLNGVMALIMCYLSEFGTFRDALGKSGYLNCLQQKCSPEHLVLAIYHLRRYDIGKPSIGELNGKWVAKYSYFAPIEGYISETVQDRRQVSINQ